MNDDKFNDNSEAAIDALKQLDERLKLLQKKFTAAKTGQVRDSLLTPHNVRSAVNLLKAINPSEKYMVNALEELMPVAKQSDETLESMISAPKSGSLVESSCTAYTKQLKSKLPQNRLI